MSALVPIPQDCVTRGDVTPAMRQWMLGTQTDAIGFDNAISLLRRPNLLVDGECQVAQGAAVPLGTGPQYGSVDMWAAWASGGAVTAGSITQSIAVNGTSTRFALAITGVTLTGAGQLSIRQRVESKRARDLVNDAASFSCVVRHGNPGAVPVVVVVSKADAVDNFGFSTTIYTSAPQLAAAGALTTIAVPNIAMGDCGNGIQIEVQLQVGACTGSFVQFADAQIVDGETVPPLVPLPFDVSLALVQRYFQKSFPYATAPAQNTGSFNSAFTRQCVVGGAVNGFTHLAFGARMRSTPTMTFFNPKAANGNWYSVGRSADSGIAGLLTDGWGEKGATVWQSQVAADAVGDVCAIHWTADARM